MIIRDNYGSRKDGLSPSPSVSPPSSILWILLLCLSLHRIAYGDPMIPSSYRFKKHDGIEREAMRERLLRTSQEDMSSSSHNLRSRPQLMETKQKGQKIIYQRRNQNLKKIDYGERHPYEIMERRRKLIEQSHREATEFNKDEYLQNDKRKLTIDWDEFKPIRIQVDSDYLLGEFKTEEETMKNEFIIYHVLPAAIEFWTKALNVYPAKRLYIEQCSLATSFDKVEGRIDADLVLYVTANRSCSGKDVSGFETKAGKCDQESGSLDNQL